MEDHEDAETTMTWDRSSWDVIFEGKDKRPMILFSIAFAYVMIKIVTELTKDQDEKCKNQKRTGKTEKRTSGTTSSKRPNEIEVIGFE